MSYAVAYWCVLAAALLPYVWVAIAKTGAPGYDNRNPRGWLAAQNSPRVQRAANAQLNAFEAFAPFAAGVLMAQLAGVSPSVLGGLSLAFVALRILHGAFYVTGWPVGRSLAWFGGLGCVLALLALAALRIA